MTSPIVEARGLRKAFRERGVLGRSRPGLVALDSVSFRLERGDFAALVGESGSGKTTLGRCLLGLLPFDAGSASVAGFDVASLTRRNQKAFRHAAQIVFQNPYASLNPALRARLSLAEAVRIHGHIPRSEVPGEVDRLAKLVHLPTDRLDEFPPALSGGEKRRVAFARALATNPEFIVADEPVSGLDLPLQVQLLDLLRRIHARRGLTFLFISHDLKVVRFLASRVLVLYRGRIVEEAPAEVFFGGGIRHPYCQELLRSALEPRRLLGLPDSAPRSPARSGGCPYRHRCPRACVDPEGPCATIQPAPAQVGRGHSVSCHRWDTP